MQIEARGFEKFDVRRLNRIFVQGQRRRFRYAEPERVTIDGRITPRRHSCNGRYQGDWRNVPRSVLVACMDWYPDVLDWRTREFERLMQRAQLYSGDPGEVVDWASLAKANAGCPEKVTLGFMFPFLEYLQ